jgi:hypothetical protein
MRLVSIALGVFFVLGLIAAHTVVRTEIHDFRFLSAVADAAHRAPSIAQAADPRAVPDGFVVVRGPIAASILQDSLFPGLETQAVLLYRRVQLCRPRDLPNPPSVPDDLGGPWVEESQLAWGTRRQDAVPPSFNFSATVTINNLTIDSELIGTSIFRLVRLGKERGRAPVTPPDGFYEFDPGVYYASTVSDVKARMEALQRGSIVQIADSLKHLLIWFVTIFVFKVDFSLYWSGAGMMTQKEAFRYLQSHCKPGDIRIRHYAFVAPNVTVFALKAGDRLRPSTINGFRIGAIGDGNRQVKGLFNAQAEAIQNELIWPRFTLITTATFAIFISIPNWMWRVFAFFMSAWIVGSLRSILWRGGVLHPQYWMGTALIAIPILLRYFRI